MELLKLAALCAVCLLPVVLLRKQAPEQALLLTIAILAVTAARCLSLALPLLEEVRTLVERLEIPVWFATLGASNAVVVQGDLPKDRAALLAKLDEAGDPAREQALRQYRKSLPHL